MYFIKQNLKYKGGENLMGNLKLPRNQKVVEFFDKLFKDKNSLKNFLSLPSVEEMYEYSKKISSEKFSFLEFAEGVNSYFGSINLKKVLNIPEYETIKISGGSKVESNIISVFMLLGPIINVVEIIRNFNEENEKLNEQIENDNQNSYELKKLLEEKKSKIEKKIKLYESLLESYKKSGSGLK